MLNAVARLLYDLGWWLAMPLIPLRLWWRGRREAGYRGQIGERFGRYPGRPPPQPLIWIHAVSLGETRAALPLIEALQRRAPDATILLTHMTATGRASGAALLGARVVQCWLPYDLPFATARFFEHFSPALGLLVETEVWPNLLRAARSHGVPVFLVNARLSARSARGYARIGALARPAFGALAGVAAQTDDDAARLAAVGAPPAVVTGNIKFDVVVTAEAVASGAALRERFGRERPVWTCASTREGEEELLLDALAGSSVPPAALLVLVPRHPQRFDEVARLLERRGIPCVRRSSDAPVDPDVRVVLGDTMGEMIAYYACADVAVIGGSFLPLGGQNLIEALAVGTPVIVGPHMFNFAEATRVAVAAGAAAQCDDASEALLEVARLMGDAGERERMGHAGRALWERHSGASGRTVSWLAAELGRRGIALGRPSGDDTTAREPG
jgi:3-deoxy-D-manno-octulosonic-acid transferase